MRISDFSNINDTHNWELILSLWEDFTQSPKPGSRPGSLKRKAAAYLGAEAGKKLSKTELRALLAKANKMKTSDKKDERQRGIQLARQVQWAFNFHK